MEGEIAKATAALVTALEHGSAHSAGELYADDATLLAPGGEPIRGRTSIEAYWATGIRLGLSALAFERHVLKALGGQAVDAGRYTISIVSDAAGPVAEHGTYLVLYRQVAEGSWRRDIEIFSADEPTAATRQEPARASFQPSRSLAVQPQTTPTSEEVMMNPITQHHPPSARARRPGHQAPPPAHHRGLRRTGRAHAASAGAGLFGAAAIAAVLLASSLPASATQAPPSARTAGLTAAGPADDGRLEATFTNSDVSVTPGLGMTELLLTGIGTVEGFGAATEVVGVILDTAVSPCGPGGASDSAQRRIVMTGGVLALHEAGMTCITASGPQAHATYRVDGRASTGIFAGARGTGTVTVDVTTHHEALSGTLILAESGA